MLNCQQVRDYFVGLPQGGPEPDLAQVKAHISRCARCRDLFVTDKVGAKRLLMDEGRARKNLDPVHYAKTKRNRVLRWLALAMSLIVLVTLWHAWGAYNDPLARVRRLIAKENYTEAILLLNGGEPKLGHGRYRQEVSWLRAQVYAELGLYIEWDTLPVRNRSREQLTPQQNALVDRYIDALYELGEYRQVCAIANYMQIGAEDHKWNLIQHALANEYISSYSSYLDQEYANLVNEDPWNEANKHLRLVKIYGHSEALAEALMGGHELPSSDQLPTLAEMASWLQANRENFSNELRQPARDIADSLLGLELAIEWSAQGFQFIQEELISLPGPGLSMLFSLPLAQELSLTQWQEIGRMLPDFHWEPYYFMAQVRTMGAEAVTQHSGPQWHVTATSDTRYERVTWSPSGLWSARQSGSVNASGRPYYGVELESSAKTLRFQGYLSWAPATDAFICRIHENESVIHYYPNPEADMVEVQLPPGYRYLGGGWWDHERIVVHHVAVSWDTYFAYNLHSGQLTPLDWALVRGARRSPAGYLLKNSRDGVSLKTSQGELVALLPYPVSLFLHGELWSPDGTQAVTWWRSWLPLKHWLMDTNGEVVELILPPRTRVMAWLDSSTLVALQTVGNLRLPLLFNIETGEYGYVQELVFEGSIQVFTGPDNQVAMGPWGEGVIYRLSGRE